MNGGPSATSPYRFVVALRLLRARRINLISILGVMVGVASIIVVLAVMDGFRLELRAIIRGTLSDLIVELNPGAQAEFRRIQEAVEAVPGVRACALQQQTGAIVRARIRDVDGSRKNTIPFVIVGVLPDAEARVSDFFRYVRPAPGQPEDPFEVVPPDGEFVQDETPRVVVSSWLAGRIGGALHGEPLRPGDRFVLLTPTVVDEEGGTEIRGNSREVVVSRVYDSHNSEYDRMHVYTSLQGPGNRFFPADGEVITELRVKLEDYTRAGALRAAVARAVAPFDPGVARDPEARVQTWEERQATLLRAVNNEKFILAFVLFFIVLVACFTIFATLTMTVVEKTRDIGVLRALGATPDGILSIFVLNGTFVGVLGAAAGYGLGLFVAARVNPIREFLRDAFGWDIFPPDIYAFDYIPTYVDHGAAGLFAAGAAAAALVFAIIPAVRAARLRPVSALRYE